MLKNIDSDMTDYYYRETCNKSYDVSNPSIDCRLATMKISTFTISIDLLYQYKIYYPERALAFSFLPQGILRINTKNT